MSLPILSELLCSIGQAMMHAERGSLCEQSIHDAYANTRDLMLSAVYATHPRLSAAIHTLARLDANGACLVVSDIFDLVDEQATEERFVRLAIEVEEAVADIMARE